MIKLLGRTLAAVLLLGVATAAAAQNPQAPRPGMPGAGQMQGMAIAGRR